MKKCFLLFLLLLATAALGASYQLDKRHDFAVSAKDADHAVIKAVSFDGELVHEETLPLRSGKATFSLTRTTPGFVLIRIDYLNNGNISASEKYSVGFEPEKIGKNSDPPSDFNAYWNASKAMAAKHDLDVKITESKFSSDAIKMYQVSFANFDGTRIYGSLGIPVNANKKLPALVVVPGAGPATENPIGYMQMDCITLFLNVHPYEPKSEENELHKQYGQDYGFLMSKPKDENFFRRAFLGMNRAIDWLWTHPQFDGKHMAIQGHSQGGGFALILAGLNGGFSYVLAAQPALCDAFAKKGGWPFYYIPASDDFKYFDAAHFAAQITCPVIVIAGGADDVCNPDSIYAAYNQIPAQKKQIIFEPDQNHGWTAGANQGFATLKNSLLKGGAK